MDHSAQLSTDAPPSALVAMVAVVFDALAAQPRCPKHARTNALPSLVFSLRRKMQLPEPRAAVAFQAFTPGRRPWKKRGSVIDGATDVMSSPKLSRTEAIRSLLETSGIVFP